MRNLDYLYQPMDINLILEGKETPFAGFSSEVTDDGAVVTVDHWTQDGTVSMTAPAERTAGKSDAELLFLAGQQAVGTEAALAALYLGDTINPVTGGVEIRTMAAHGEVFSAKSQTFAEAVRRTLEAHTLYEG